MAQRRSRLCALAAAVQLCGCRDDHRRSITAGFSQIGAESAWRTAESGSIRAEDARPTRRLKREARCRAIDMDSAWQDARPTRRGGMNSAPEAQSRGRMPSD